MVYGALAGIHGNREALAAALTALERRGAERIVCLGDVVGYNADPDECVALVRSRCAVALAGMHDLIALGQIDFRRCSNDTEYSLRRTRRTLSRDSAAYLGGLPVNATLENGVALIYGGVRNVQHSLSSAARIAQNAAWLHEDVPGARLCLYGGSHEPKVYELAEAVPEARIDEPRELPAQGQLRLRPESTYFINPGSVDASRKGSRKFAECALFDSSAATVEFLRVPYDGAATEAKAAVFGYRINPLVDRLYTLRRRVAARL